MEKKGPYYKYHFTPKDDAYILENYLTVSNKEMAESLNVGLTSLRNHMYFVLKIRRFAKWDVWTEQQNQYVVDNFRKTSDAEMSAYLTENLPREDGRPVCRKMVQKKRKLLCLHRTPEEITALYQTEFLQKKMRTIEKNSASRNQHDNWIATILAGRKNTPLRKELMANPEKYKDLFEIKRLQIQLTKNINHDNSSNSNL